MWIWAKSRRKDLVFLFLLLTFCFPDPLIELRDGNMVLWSLHNSSRLSLSLLHCAFALSLYSSLETLKFTMSFGFGCARIAYEIYRGLREAPGECKEFAEELLQYRQVLLRLGHTVESNKKYCNESDGFVLGSHVEGCNDLLYSQILDVGHRSVTFFGSRNGLKNDESSPRHEVSGWHILQRSRDLKWSRRIPKFRQQIRVQIEKLTAYTVLLLQ